MGGTYSSRYHTRYSWVRGGPFQRSGTKTTSRHRVQASTVTTWARQARRRKNSSPLRLRKRMGSPPIRRSFYNYHTIWGGEHKAFPGGREFSPNPRGRILLWEGLILSYKKMRKFVKKYRRSCAKSRGSWGREGVNSKEHCDYRFLLRTSSTIQRIRQNPAVSNME